MSKDNEPRRAWNDQESSLNEWDRPRFQTIGGRSILHNQVDGNDSSFSRPLPAEVNRSFPDHTGDRQRLQHEAHFPRGSSRRPEHDESRAPPLRRYRSSIDQGNLPGIAHSPNFSRYQMSPRISDGHRVGSDHDESRAPSRRHSTAFHPYSPAGDHASSTYARAAMRERDGQAKLKIHPPSQRASGKEAFKGSETRRILVNAKDETEGFRRSSSLSLSPLKPIIKADDTMDRHFGSRRTDRELGRRSASPVSDMASRQPYSAVSSKREYRELGGAVGSVFTRPSAQPRPSTQENPFSSPTTPIQSIQSIDESRYPVDPPPARLSHSQSSSRERPSGRAWFAPGPPGFHPDATKWPSDHLRAYDAGYDDAMRSVENGIFGVDGIQYRNPILVRRDIPIDSLGPQQPYHQDIDDRQVGGPISAPMVTHPPSLDHHRSQARMSYMEGPPGPYHPNPAIMSSYGPMMPPFAHARGYPRPEYPFDPYHPMAHPLYAYGHMSYLGGPARTTRQLISCYPCRNRKLKCDGQKPCAQCVRRGSEADCAYATHVRRRGKGKKASEGGESSGEEESGAGNQDKRGSVDSLGTPQAGQDVTRDGSRAGTRDGTQDGARDGMRDGTRDGTRDSIRDGNRGGTQDDRRSRDPSIVAVEHPEQADVKPPSPILFMPDGERIRSNEAE